MTPKELCQQTPPQPGGIFLPEMTPLYQDSQEFLNQYVLQMGSMNRVVLQAALNSDQQLALVVAPDTEQIGNITMHFDARASFNKSYLWRVIAADTERHDRQEYAIVSTPTVTHVSRQQRNHQGKLERAGQLDTQTTSDVILAVRGMMRSPLVGEYLRQHTCRQPETKSSNQSAPVKTCSPSITPEVILTPQELIMKKVMGAVSSIEKLATHKRESDQARRLLQRFDEPALQSYQRIFRAFIERVSGENIVRGSIMVPFFEAVMDRAHQYQDTSATITSAGEQLAAYLVTSNIDKLPFGFYIEINDEGQSELRTKDSNGRSVWFNHWRDVRDPGARAASVDDYATLLVYWLKTQ